MTDSTWKPGIAKGLLVEVVAEMLEAMVSVLVEDWVAVDVIVNVRGLYGCGPMKFAGSKSVGSGF